MSTTESRLEHNFCDWCKAKQIVPVKGPSQIVKGFPDRFMQLPNGGGTIYVEFKGTSYYGLTPIQVWWKNYLIASSPNRYFLVETDEQLDALKARCLRFIAIGAKLTAYETELLG
jgi:hypothetical protein